MPSENNVAAFAEGCCGPDGDAVREALRLWRLARVEQRGILPGLRAPAPEYVRDARELLAALAAEYEKAGAPPLRVLQRRGGYTGPAGREVYALPLATAWRIVNRKRLPADVHQLDAFLTGCGVTGKTMTTWHHAWQHARAEPAAPRRGQTEDPAPPTIRPRIDKLLEALTPKDAEAGLLAALHTMVSGEAKRNGVAVPTGYELVYDPTYRAHIHLRRKPPPRRLRVIQRRPKPSPNLSTAPEEAVIVECKRA